MEDRTPTTTNLGTRKLQQVTSSHVVTIPNVAIITLGWKPHDVLHVSMIDNEYLVIKKVVE
jgi:hypothetical protein